MDRLYQVQVTTPAGTLPAIPQQVSFPLEDANLDSLTILIPDGHAGLTGIRILQAQQEIVPWSNNDWLISNNEIITVTVNTQVAIEGLTIETYNEDAFNHSHWIRAVISDLAQQTAPTATLTNAIPGIVLSNM